MDAQYALLRDRCFDPSTGMVLDRALAEKMMHLRDFVVRMDRDSVLSLQVLPNGLSEPLFPGPADGAAAVGREATELVILRGMADAAGHGFVVADARGTAAYVNPAMCQLLGAESPDAIVGTSVLDNYPEDQHDRAVNVMLKATLETGRWVGELTLRSRSGERIDTMHSCFLVHGERGAEPYIGALVIDIRPQKQIANALRASEANFRALVENANDGILIATETGVHAYVNPRVSEMTGYTARELTTTIGLRELAHPDELENLIRVFRHRMEAGEGPRSFPTRIVHKDGRVVHVEVTGARTIWQGRPADTVIMRDVSRRQEIEQALRESEERYSLLVEQSRDGVAIVQDDVCVFVSRPMAAMLGYPVEELAGRHYLDLVVAEDQARVADTYRQRLAGNEQMARGITLLRHRDGSVGRYEGYSAIIHYRGRPAMLAFVRHPFPGATGSRGHVGEGA
jgi:PAS domain S-box-containing protein